MPPKFQPLDFLQLDTLLSEDERLIRDNTRAFVEDNVIPIIEQCNRDARFPRELVPKMGELGFFGATIDGYGCAGLNNVEYGLLTQELERGDSGLRSFVSVQSALVMYPIYAFGSDEQKNLWLPQLATADVAVIWAKLDDSTDSIRGFLVETDRPGFTARDIHGKFSLRASVTSGLSLENVRIPAASLLPKAAGIKSPLMCLSQARYGISWGAIGAAMAVYDTALQYARQRKQFRNQPIASHQLVQEKLVWMATEITKAQLLALQVGRLKDAGRAQFQHISMAKRNNVWMALECARMARDILGANGIVDDYPIMRHMMNLESVKTYEGTHDIHTLILGQYLTGHSAF
jgi:glutaryl-CoA dehydrogenase